VPVQHCLDLCNAVKDLVETAERYLAEKQAEQREQSDKEARARNTPSYGDPCECAENYRCHYCYSRQNGNFVSDDPFH